MHQICCTSYCFRGLPGLVFLSRLISNICSDQGKRDDFKAVSLEVHHKVDYTPRFMKPPLVKVLVLLFMIFLQVAQELKIRKPSDRGRKRSKRSPEAVHQDFLEREWNWTLRRLQREERLERGEVVEEEEEWQEEEVDEDGDREDEEDEEEDVDDVESDMRRERREARRDWEPSLEWQRDQAKKKKCKKFDKKCQEEEVRTKGASRCPNSPPIDIYDDRAASGAGEHQGELATLPDRLPNLPGLLRAGLL